MLGSLKPTEALLPIVSIQPFDLVGTDYLGSISPISKRGARFIQIGVDYMCVFSNSSRFHAVLMRASYLLHCIFFSSLENLVDLADSRDSPKNILITSPQKPNRDFSILRPSRHQSVQETTRFATIAALPLYLTIDSDAEPWIAG